ncbi:MAG: DUF1036 domain-containing protein [Euryhalocaulis sp.]|uniref:DUF1036 domain-containing protein n=1 Tax=Euryhalocaulis sp. TaxID=2744307 RepID=UPI0017D847A8|nr:DUF1036 domain-containing protein [Euryhalocaulis sp.]MBA4801645.1 DUF1036 domain-containing protein [Euryhalocaulis sp.]
MIRSALLALALSAAGGGAANAWDLCNETSFILEAAVAYQDSGAIMTEGWYRIRPGECVEGGPEDVIGPRFVYARSALAHRGGRREWQGLEALCADSGDFLLPGDANCEAEGLETLFFNAVSPAAEDSTFVEPADYGDKAELAGFQRLAGDAGGDLSMESLSESRAVRAAETVLANEKGARPEDRAAWMDWLETVAREQREAEGLSICNQADRTIWTAYGREDEDTGRSRGWWSIAPRACAKVLGEPLQAAGKYFIYAGLPADDPAADDHMLLSATEAFCLAPTRFSINGREECSDRGYDEGRFMRVATGEDRGVTITLGPGDFEGAEEPEDRPALRR